MGSQCSQESCHSRGRQPSPSLPGAYPPSPTPPPSPGPFSPLPIASSSATSVEPTPLVPHPSSLRAQDRHVTSAADSVNARLVTLAKPASPVHSPTDSLRCLPHPSPDLASSSQIQQIETTTADSAQQSHETSDPGSIPLPASPVLEASDIDHIHAELSDSILSSSAQFTHLSIPLPPSPSPNQLSITSATSLHRQAIADVPLPDSLPASPSALNLCLPDDTHADTHPPISVEPAVDEANPSEGVAVPNPPCQTTATRQANTDSADVGSNQDDKIDEVILGGNNEQMDINTEYVTEDEEHNDFDDQFDDNDLEAINNDYDNDNDRDDEEEEDHDRIYNEVRQIIVSPSRRPYSPSPDKRFYRAPGHVAMPRPPINTTNAFASLSAFPLLPAPSPFSTPFSARSETASRSEQWERSEKVRQRFGGFSERRKKGSGPYAPLSTPRQVPLKPSMKTEEADRNPMRSRGLSQVTKRLKDENRDEDEDGETYDVDNDSEDEYGNPQKHDKARGRDTATPSETLVNHPIQPIQPGSSLPLPVTMSTTAGTLKFHPSFPPVPTQAVFTCTDGVSFSFSLPLLSAISKYFSSLSIPSLPLIHSTPTGSHVPHIHLDTTSPPLAIVLSLLRSSIEGALPSRLLPTLKHQAGLGVLQSAISLTQTLEIPLVARLLSRAYVPSIGSATLEVYAIAVAAGDTDLSTYIQPKLFGLDLTREAKYATSILPATDWAELVDTHAVRHKRYADIERLLRRGPPYRPANYNNFHFRCIRGDGCEGYTLANRRFKWLRTKAVDAAIKAFRAADDEVAIKAMYSAVRETVGCQRCADRLNEEFAGALIVVNRGGQ